MNNHTGTRPITTNITPMTPLNQSPKAADTKNGTLSPTNRMGHAHTMRGVPKPCAKSAPIATASRPPKMFHGVNASTFAGHSTSIWYGPPLAQKPPSDMTVNAVRYSVVKQNAKRNQDSAAPRNRTTGESRQGHVIGADDEAVVTVHTVLVSATRPQPRTLAGRYVRLDPLTHDDLGDLWRAIGRPEVFAGGYAGGPAGLPPDEASFVAWAKRLYRWDDGNVYAVRIAAGPDAGTLVGTSTMADFDLPVRGTHIGWTAYDPRVWGTAVNPEAKLLMLTEAFDHGFERVKLQADSLNARSRAAIELLGATFEGVLRKARLRADGTLSGTAVYSILDDEWPSVRTGLLQRLDAWGDRPVPLR